MLRSRLAVGGFVVVGLALSSLPLQAQGEANRVPLQPMVPSGDIVAPFFDGFYRNLDGTFTFSFGFMNRNLEEIVDIPIGENNFITPSQFNGVQTTHFPPVSYGGFSGRRERGAFTVTIPAEMADQDVVWTLTHAGHTYSVPGRVGEAYELSHTPMAAGSLPPSLKFSADGEWKHGRTGATAEPLTVKVGEPLALNVWVRDRGEREDPRLRRVNTTWQKHQGPGTVTFSSRTARINEGEGEAPTTATFGAPGEYVLRVRVDNFGGASDSSFGNQCCWSNGYVPVTVTE